jgi:hypothetical protein
VQLSPCPGASTILDYSWSVQEQPVGITNTALNEATRRTPTLHIDPGTLVPGFYKYRLDVQDTDDPEIAAYAIISVQVKNSQVEVRIKDGDRTASRSTPLVVDGSPTHDPDDSVCPTCGFTYAWSCATPEGFSCFDGFATNDDAGINGYAAGDPFSSDKVLTLANDPTDPLSFLRLGRLVFTLLAQKNSASRQPPETAMGTTTVTITLVSGMVPACSISGVPNVALPEDQLILQAAARPTPENGNLSYRWYEEVSYDSGGLDGESLAGEYSSYLGRLGDGSAIPARRGAIELGSAPLFFSAGAFARQGGTNFRAVLEVREAATVPGAGASVCVARASVSFNDQPSGGITTITPRSGKTMLTTYTATFTNWIDTIPSGSPLKYSVSILDGGLIAFSNGSNTAKTEVYTPQPTASLSFKLPAAQTYSLALDVVDSLGSTTRTIVDVVNTYAAFGPTAAASAAAVAAATFDVSGQGMVVAAAFANRADDAGSSGGSGSSGGGGYNLGNQSVSYNLGNGTIGNRTITGMCYGNTDATDDVACPSGYSPKQPNHQCDIGGRCDIVACCVRTSTGRRRLQNACVLSAQTAPVIPANGVAAAGCGAGDTVQSGANCSQTCQAGFVQTGYPPLCTNGVMSTSTVQCSCLVCDLTRNVNEMLSKSVLDAPSVSQFLSQLSLLASADAAALPAHIGTVTELLQAYQTTINAGRDLGFTADAANKALATAFGISAEAVADTCSMGNHTSSRNILLQNLALNDVGIGVLRHPLPAGVQAGDVASTISHGAGLARLAVTTQRVLFRKGTDTLQPLIVPMDAVMQAMMAGRASVAATGSQTCLDGVKNGDEVEADCGGSQCGSCSIRRFDAIHEQIGPAAWCGSGTPRLVSDIHRFTYYDADGPAARVVTPLAITATSQVALGTVTLSIRYALGPETETFLACAKWQLRTNAWSTAGISALAFEASQVACELAYLEAGQFLSVLEFNLTKCNASQYQAVAGNRTQDRKCKALTICQHYEFESMPASATSDRVCQPLTICAKPGANTVESVPATATSDRTCVCARGYWEGPPQCTNGGNVSSSNACTGVATGNLWFAENTSCTDSAGNLVHGANTSVKCTGLTGSVYSTGVSDGCIPWTLCSSQGVGMVEDMAPSTTRDRSCSCDVRSSCTHNTSQITYNKSRAACGTGTFSPGYYSVGHPPTCVTVTECHADAVETKKATATSDRTCHCQDGFWGTGSACARHRACKLGSPAQCSNSGNATTQTACEDAGNNYTAAVPQLQFEKAAGNCTSNAICGTLTTCVTGQEYQLVAGTTKADRQCESVSSLCNSSSEWESKAPAATSDRQCKQATVCNSSLEFEAAPLLPKRDRQCQAYTVCKDYQWQFRAPEPKRDLGCANITGPCNAQYSYEAQAPNATADRVCSQASICTDGQEFESVPLSAKADRVCRAFAVCNSSEWESKAPAATSDRQCTPLTLCDKNAHISTNSTALSDLACTCNLGYTGNGSSCAKTKSDCAGQWSIGVCSRSCGNGIVTKTWVVTAMATAGGQACAHENGATKVEVCVNVCCPGTFRDGSACQAKKICGPGMGVISNGSSTADRECGVIVTSALALKGAVQPTAFSTSLQSTLPPGSRVKITAFEQKAEASATLPGTAADFDIAAQTQFKQGVATSAQVNVNDVAITKITDSSSRRRLWKLTSPPSGPISGAEARRRLAVSGVKLDYAVTVTDAAKAATVASTMSDPAGFSKTLGTYLDVNVTVTQPTVTTKLEYTVEIQAAALGSTQSSGELASSVINTLSDATALTALANSARVSGTPTITEEAVVTAPPKQIVATNCAGAWGADTVCSKTCGRGTKTRQYQVSVFAANGGTFCTAADGSEVKDRDVQSRACEARRCANTLTMQLTLAKTIADIGLASSDLRKHFIAQFTTDVSNLLGIIQSRVVVNSIASGSIVVDFSIAPDANGDAFPIATVTTVFGVTGVSIAGTTTTSATTSAAISVSGLAGSSSGASTTPAPASASSSSAGVIIAILVVVVLIGVVAAIFMKKRNARSIEAVGATQRTRPAMMSPAAAAYLTGDEDPSTTGDAGETSGGKTRKSGRKLSF